MFHVADWMPTLLEAIGVKRSVGVLPLDGVSHWQNLKYFPSRPSPRDTILLNIDRMWHRGYEPTPKNFTKYPNPYFDTHIHSGLIFQNWKLLTGDPGHGAFYLNKTDDPNPYPSVQLFDLSSDPLELVNLAPYFPSVVDTMLQKIDEFDQTSAPIYFPPYDEVC